DTKRKSPTSSVGTSEPEGMLNGWKRSVRTTSAISSASMMTLTVSHQPSSFLTGVAPASAGFTLFSLICVTTPFLVFSRPACAASYTDAVRPSQAARAHGPRTCLNDGFRFGSRQENERARRLARLERPVRLGSLGERQATADVNGHVAFPDRADELARHLLEPRPVGHEGEEGRPGGEQRAFAAEQPEVESLDSP